MQKAGENGIMSDRVWDIIYYGGNKVEKLNIQPIMMASDINVYSVARAYHEQYGVKTLMLARNPGAVTNDSKILIPRYIPDLDETEVFRRVMKEIYEEYKEKDPSKILILHGNADHYVRLIVENKDYLKDMFVVPYSDKKALDNIVLKATFYGLCEKYGLDFANTLVYTPDMGMDFTLDFDFPVVLKPSDSVKYNKHSFEGQHKVYFIKERKKLEETIKQIYDNGYDDKMIIQEMVEGADDSIYDMHVYVGKDHKVKLINFGNVILEEHTPKGIGSNAATITTYDRDIMSKVGYLLEDIGYEGWADADFKYDKKRDKILIFEINIRQGRSNYRITGQGYNLAKYIVEDYVLNKPIKPEYANSDFCWSVVPKGIVYKYVRDPEKVKKFKKLVSEGKYCNSLYYDKDRGFKRMLYLRLRDMNMYRKYKRYLGK